MLAIKELDVEETVDFDKGSELSVNAVLFCKSVVDDSESTGGGLSATEDVTDEGVEDGVESNDIDEFNDKGNEERSAVMLVDTVFRLLLEVFFCFFTSFTFSDFNEVISILNFFTLSSRFSHFCSSL